MKAEMTVHSSHARRSSGGRSAIAVILALTLSMVACGDDDTDSSSAEGGTVTVFAAASLTDAFTEIAAAFEAENPGVTVEFNFGPSSGLREQILSGAPADVYASANTSNMDAIVDDGAASAPSIFARNGLAIAVPLGNPAAIIGLSDFADPDLFLGLCAEQVPCGIFARQALAAAGVKPSLDTNATDVRALLTQIAAGELDAGIVYVTDVESAAGEVEGIDLPADLDVIAEYPIAPLTEAGSPELARGFVDFVLSDPGQQILESFAFTSP